jgi:tRNA(Arg) A34 adenosine deaminase TadA
MMNDEPFMEQAIAACRRGIAAGQTPFGCVIVKDGRVAAEAHNTVWADTDPSAHAEVNAIRRAARALGSIELAGCTLYTTCEPCPMCLAASHWAKLGRVVFGASIAEAAEAGFSELPISAERMVELGRSPLRVRGGVLREACVALFDEWKAAGRSRTY